MSLEVISIRRLLFVVSYRNTYHIVRKFDQLRFIIQFIHIILLRSSQCEKLVGLEFDVVQVYTFMFIPPNLETTVFRLAAVRVSPAPTYSLLGSASVVVFVVDRALIAR